MPSPTEITVPQLARLIGSPSAPCIVDVRSAEDFDADLFGAAEKKPAGQNDDHAQSRFDQNAPPRIGEANCLVGR